MSKWAENITKDIYSTWKEKYSFWKRGFKIFYSPITKKQKLVIISFQPGGEEIHYIAENKEAFDIGDFSLPQINEFLTTEYKMARKMRDLFNGLEKILKNSIVFPWIFFRAPTIFTWNTQIEKKIRLEMEGLCLQTITKILDKIRPQKILIIGIDTYDRFKDKFGPEKNEIILLPHPKNNTRMVVSSIIGNYDILAIIHPTGARISNQNWLHIKDLFKNWVSNDINK